MSTINLLTFNFICFEFADQTVSKQPGSTQILWKLINFTNINMEPATPSTPSTQEPTSAKKLTDVNTDCLEKMFKYLSFEELLNVADSNKHLREAAELVYKMKYSRKKLILSIYNGALRLVSHHIDENSISIRTLKMCLQLLRCFGHLIPNIAIKDVPQKLQEKSLVGFGRAMTYFNEYCSNSFITIEICADLKELLHQEGPYLKLRNIEVYGYDLPTNVLNQLFPNMLNLTMNYVGNCFKDGKCIAVDFENVEKYIPYMEHLEINIDYRETRYCIRTRRQIKNRFRKGILKNIKKFGEIRRENPETRLPFDHLEEFNLHMSFYDDDEKIFSFFSKYTTVLKLKLSFHYTNWNERYQITDNVINIPKLAITFPLVKEIDFRCCKFTADGIEQLINQFKALEKFSVYLEQGSEYHDIEKSLRSEWQGSVEAIGNRYECEFHRNP